VEVETRVALRFFQLGGGEDPKKLEKLEQWVSFSADTVQLGRLHRNLQVLNRTEKHNVTRRAAGCWHTLRCSHAPIRDAARRGILHARA
jgi:hypothetical protein